MSLKLFRNQNNNSSAWAFYDRDWEYPLKQWQFPAGETGLKLETREGIWGQHFMVLLHWESNNDLWALGQLVDVLREGNAASISLDIPYFPYSRQDRPCHPGEGHALRVVTQFINSMGFQAVRTLDPHSTVLGALIEKLHYVPQWSCATSLPKYDVLIAPDAGASKKIFQHRQVKEGNTGVVIAEKSRDANGDIIGMYLPSPMLLHGKRVCVVDDLCDGGATFLAVADALGDRVKPEVFDLYVTHGIFTKGLGELDKRYGTIYTANLMNPALKGYVQEI